MKTAALIGSGFILAVLIGRPDIPIRAIYRAYRLAWPAAQAAGDEGAR